MVTIEGTLNKSINAVLYGLSTDTKPTKTFQGKDIPNGAKFFEMDTKAVYFYDKENEKWV